MRFHWQACSWIHPPNPTETSWLLTSCQATLWALQIPKRIKDPFCGLATPHFNVCPPLSPNAQLTGSSLSWEQAERERENTFPVTGNSGERPVRRPQLLNGRYQDPLNMLISLCVASLSKRVLVAEEVAQRLQTTVRSHDKRTWKRILKLTVPTYRKSWKREKKWQKFVTKILIFKHTESSLAYLTIWSYRIVLKNVSKHNEYNKWF